MFSWQKDVNIHFRPCCKSDESVCSPSVACAMTNSCCVVGCSNRIGRTLKGVKVECKNKGIRYFSFPTPDPEQWEKWVSAVKRKDGGKPWKPTQWSKVCSEHFVGGQWSRTRGHPSFAPTLKMGHHEEAEEATEKRKLEESRPTRSAETPNSLIGWTPGASSEGSPRDYAFSVLIQTRVLLATSPILV